MKEHFETIKMLLEQGHSYTSVAKQLGVSKQAIHQFCKKNNLEKIWKVKGESSYHVKKNTFQLGPDMYAVCSLKFIRKKQNCKNSKTLFNLEMSDIEWPTHCPILGIELDWLGLNGDFRSEASPSFDKINPSLGYVKGNVRIISWRANRIKNDGTAEEHRKIADYIDKYGN